jgi:hypothetical protein
MTARDSDKRRNADLAAIHVAKKRLGLDDEVYRALVRRVSEDFRPEEPVESAGDMTSDERAALLQELRAMGFEAGPPPGQERAFGKSSEPHVRKLYACAYQLIRDGAIAPRDPACWLRKFTKRLTGVDDPRWLTAGDCNKVIEALKAWHKRLNARAAQKQANAPALNLPIRKIAGELMGRFLDIPDPRAGARQQIALMSRYAWPKPEIAARAASLIREGSEAIHHALADWDYRGAKRETRLLWMRLMELDPSFRKFVMREIERHERENVQAAQTASMERGEVKES